MVCVYVGDACVNVFLLDGIINLKYTVLGKGLVHTLTVMNDELLVS